MSSSQFANQASMAVAKKTLDIARQQGAQIVQMIENSTIKAGDPLVAKASGLGQNLDVYG